MYNMLEYIYSKRVKSYEINNMNLKPRNFLNDKDQLKLNVPTVN